MPGDYTFQQHYFARETIDVTILIGTPGYPNAVPGLSGYLTYIQKITLSITTHVAGDRYLFNDDGDGASEVAAHTDAAAGAGVLSVVVWDLGPTGRPLKAGANLDVSHSGAGAAVAHIEGYYLKTSVAWTAPLSYSQQVVADGAIGYWRLGEPSGSVAADSSGNGRDGVYVGGVTLGQAGALSDGNTAVLFDGVNGEVTNASVALQKAAGPFTLEAWAKLGTGSSDAGIAGRGAPNSMQITWHNGTAIFIYAGNSFATAALSGTLWHHVVGTWDGTTDANGIKLYIDGVLAAQGTSTATVISASNFNIGNAVGGTFFNGTIDEVAIYSVVLTPAKILEHYKARL